MASTRDAEPVPESLSSLADTAHQELKIPEVAAKHGGWKASQQISAVETQNAWTYCILLLFDMLMAVTV
ncbi:hypothetical protein PENANT_c028G03703, partial [Penicillium antarcticum]